jgi:glycosyltransferase involved in cell wall biosynthesis
MASEKIKVLFLSSWYPTRVHELYGDFVKRHAKAVSKYSKVLCFHVIKDENLNSNHEITETISDGLTEVVYYFNCRRFTKLNYILSYLKGFKYIKRKYWKPDIIHGNVLYPIGVIVFLFSFFNNIPFVITEHWTGFLNGTYKGFSRFQKNVFNYIAKKAKSILPVTLDLKRAMIKSGVKGNYSVVPNVVETDLFNLNDNPRNKNKSILHVSNLDDSHKNITGLLRVISKLYHKRQDFVLNIIHSEENIALKDYAISLGLDNSIVNFCGRKEYAEVAEYMSKSAFLVLFSNYENLPCVIVEAFASGLPVLSTDVGGISEHFDEEKGILIEKGDEQALFDKMNCMLDNFQNYDKALLREYAITNFSYENIGKEYFKIYQNILNV